MLLCLFALAGSARAEDVREEISVIERSLVQTLRDPVQLSALRSLVAVQIEYRIAAGLSGQEQFVRFGRIWTNFNAVMYGGGPAAIRARLEVGEKTGPTFIDAVERAFADNAAVYDSFQDHLIEDVFGVREDRAELKHRLLRAMLAYAVMNWLREPSLEADWYSETWVFPACPVALP